VRITAVASRIRLPGNPGALTGAAAHRGLGLITLLLTA